MKMPASRSRRAMHPTPRIGRLVSGVRRMVRPMDDPAFPHREDYACWEKKRCNPAATAQGIRKLRVAIQCITRHPRAHIYCYVVLLCRLTACMSGNDLYLPPCRARPACGDHVCHAFAYPDAAAPG